MELASGTARQRVAVPLVLAPLATTRPCPGQAPTNIEKAAGRIRHTSGRKKSTRTWGSRRHQTFFFLFSYPFIVLCFFPCCQKCVCGGGSSVRFLPSPRNADKMCTLHPCACAGGPNVPPVVAAARAARLVRPGLEKRAQARPRRACASFGFYQK